MAQSFATATCGFVMSSPGSSDVGFTHRHSRAYTALGALHRLELRPRCPGVLRLLILGADRREGVSPEGTNVVFRGLGEDCGAWRVSDNASTGESATPWSRVMRSIQEIELLCVGPNVSVATDVKPWPAWHQAKQLRKEKENTGDAIAIKTAYRSGLFHELSDDLSDGSHAFEPDLCLAYNAGIWGYSQREWGRSLEIVLGKLKAPIVFTAYSADEAENDEDALENMGGYFRFSEDESVTKSSASSQVTFAWRAEINPFRSLVRRGLEFDKTRYVDLNEINETTDEAEIEMSENHAWLCVTPA